MKSTCWGGTRSTRGRLVSMTAAVVVVALLPSLSISAGSLFAGSDLTSDEVADEIARVQLQADAAASALEEAQFESEALAEELAKAQQDVAEASAVYGEMESTLADVAVRRYMNAGRASPVILNDDPMTRIETEVLSLVATQEGSVDLDDYADTRRDLEEKQKRVEELTAENAALQEEIAGHQEELDEQLDALGDLYEQLKDEEIRAAYEKRMAEIRAEQEAAAARAAAQVQAQQAAQAQAATPARGGGAPASPETTSTPSTSGAAVTPSPASIPQASVPDDATTSVDDPVEATVPAPVTTLPPPPPPVITSDWVCPVAGPTAFGDTWGAARSGGRSHEGVDMMASLGTPVVAVVSGSVLMKTTSLGGNSAWLTGNDGNKYFYAHLDDWAGPTRSVSIGEVIGYVGHTGNTSVNHLHFEIHPGGGRAVNPYPTVRQHC